MVVLAYRTFLLDIPQDPVLMFLFAGGEVRGVNPSHSLRTTPHW